MKLSEIVGNQKLVSILQKRTLPQSTIFTGPDGIGKKTAALLLAALANCSSPISNDLCGLCSSCIKALSGNHPDISLFEPDKVYLKIDQMRKLSREAVYRPYEGNLRFFVVDQAEKMTTEAANALLKTLEEPPSTSRLILITASSEQLLSTIRSRCQVFKFQRLCKQDIETYLRQNQFEGNPELRASLSNGSLGAAIDLNLDQYLEDRDRILQILKNWFDHRSFAQVFEACETDPLRLQLKNRETVKGYLKHLETVLYDLYFFLVDTPERVVNLDKIQELSQMAMGLRQEQIRALLDSTTRSRKELSGNVNPLMCFETLWLDSAQIG